MNHPVTPLHRLGPASIVFEIEPDQLNRSALDAEGPVAPEHVAFRGVRVAHAGPDRVA